MKIVRPKTSGVVLLTEHLSIPIKDFSEEQIEAVKDSLTFDNPAYISAKRFSPYSQIYVEPMLAYYVSSRGFLHVPAGTDLSVLNNPAVKDCRDTVQPTTVPRFALNLREDQQIAADCFLKQNKGTKLRGAVQLPTGKGKTVLALYLASRLKQRTLVIVHKDDLVMGWQKDIKLCFDSKCEPGLIKAKSRKVGDFITIATAQTLSRMDEQELSTYLHAFGFVVLDEMHHCPASMFDFVDRFSSRYRLGLTATAERKDGLAHVMKLYFGDFCYKYKATQAEKDILPVTVIPRNVDFLHITPVCAKDDKNRWFVKDPRADPRNYKLQDDEEFISNIPYNSRPRIVFGDYSDLIVRLMKDNVSQDIFSEYKKGHSCIAFFSQKQQVDDFAEYLSTEYHIPREDVLKYYGNNSSKQNEAVLACAESKRQRVTLATYSKATEGTNVKQWEVAFLVSSINDAKNAEQAVGRIRRTTDKPKLECALVYDYRCPYVYSISSHATTRDRRYRKLGFSLAVRKSSNKVDNVSKQGRARKSNNIFTRGYSH